MAAVEVGGRPARAFEFKARGREFLFHRVLAALRTGFDRSIADFLQVILFEPAGGALVSVDGHFVSIVRKMSGMEIIGPALDFARCGGWHFPQRKQEETGASVSEKRPFGENFS